MNQKIQVALATSKAKADAKAKARANKKAESRADNDVTENRIYLNDILRGEWG